MVSVRLPPLPPKVILPLGTRVWFAEDPETVKAVSAVSISATVKLIGPTAVSCVVIWLAIFEIVGASFTGLTVRRKLVLELEVPSFTLTVIVALPDWFAAGV